MEKLKNTDKKASAQREKLERPPISQLPFQNKTILVWFNQTRIF